MDFVYIFSEIVVFSDTDLAKIKALGGVDISFETPVKAGNFELELSGGTDLENLRLDCNLFSGQFSGGCDVSASKLTARNCNAEFSGTADENIYVTGHLDIGVSGTADVICSGKPGDVTKRVDRNSSLSFR
ncbi:GIN domain-containing protein [Proteiniphilum sp. UBA5384]|uniref:GIN domain-containing protein n=1 Tax=Proteiniphilum sp. UBA5384 TaxID=1947279 RepID=UPI0025EEAB19|nr:DUF2807 domain-containing protein [Proteiniphilum sp. UBA5384]